MPQTEVLLQDAIDEIAAENERLRAEKERLIALVDDAIGVLTLLANTGLDPKSRSGQVQIAMIRGMQLGWNCWRGR